MPERAAAKPEADFPATTLHIQRLMMPCVGLQTCRLGYPTFCYPKPHPIWVTILLQVRDAFFGGYPL